MDKSNTLTSTSKRTLSSSLSNIALATRLPASVESQSCGYVFRTPDNNFKLLESQPKNTKKEAFKTSVFSRIAKQAISLQSCQMYPGLMILDKQLDFNGHCKGWYSASLDP